MHHTALSAQEWNFHPYQRVCFLCSFQPSKHAGRDEEGSRPQALALIAAAKMSLGSATVPVEPLDETSKIPRTLFALLSNITLNCSTNSILELSQFSTRILWASFEPEILGRSEGLTFDL